MSEQQRDDRRAAPPFRGGCRAKPWGGRGGARRCRVVGAERPGLGSVTAVGPFQAVRVVVWWRWSLVRL